MKSGDNAVTKILKELTEQLDNLEDLMDATNYGDGTADMGSIAVPGGDLELTAQTAGTPFSCRYRCSRTWGRHDYE